MTIRENLLAVMNYRSFERIPVISFGYWRETLLKWAEEGHISREMAREWRDGNRYDRVLQNRLGFDFNWSVCVKKKGGSTSLYPTFEKIVLEEREDGTRYVSSKEGVVLMEKAGAVSIPYEVSHTLRDRASWEKDYLPRLQFSPDRVDADEIRLHAAENGTRSDPLGIYAGSLIGDMRNWLGVEGLSYLYADDFDLYKEIIDTVGTLWYDTTKYILELGFRPDFSYYWEDICFKNGPLVIPSVFEELVGVHYARINGLLKKYGVTVMSVDCDGMIDALIPVWLQNGVNTMFPIEVGTWNASIGPWRKKYGRELRGVGGMNKNVFAQDYRAIDREIERLESLMSLGGYIPCPDHRIPPDAKFENVQYYCDRMRNLVL